ncbi:MAG: hypothetical protein ACXWD5_16930 [Mycobacterium sp.]
MPSISPLIAQIFDGPETVRARRARDKFRTRNEFRRKARPTQR